MTLFYAAAAGLIALAWWLLTPARRAVGPAMSAAAGTNLEILKEQLAALDAELAAGQLDAVQHRSGRNQIERRVLEETQALQPGGSSTGVLGAVGTHRSPTLRTARAGLAVATGVAAFGLYAVLGNPGAVASGGAPQAMTAAADNEASAVEVDAMLAEMEKRLDRLPVQADDAQGWTVIARSHAALERFEAASRAFRRAIALDPGNAQLLADHADVLAMLQGRTTAGEPARLVARALQIDPDNVKALALAGTAAFESRDYARAAVHWRKALALAPADSEFASGLRRSLDETSALAQRGVGGDGADGSSAAPADAAAAAGPARIVGSVSIAPALAGRIAATDTLYIFARAPQGPRMPLAIVRRAADTWPAEFTLDDGMAMSPEMKLSTQPRVVVSARISRSGSALPQPGDLQGQTLPVGTAPGAPVRVVIDSVVP